MVWSRVRGGVLPARGVAGGGVLPQSFSFGHTPLNRTRGLGRAAGGAKSCWQMRAPARSGKPTNHLNLNYGKKRPNHNGGSETDIFNTIPRTKGTSLPDLDCRASLSLGPGKRGAKNKFFAVDTPPCFFSWVYGGPRGHSFHPPPRPPVGTECYSPFPS